MTSVQASIISFSQSFTLNYDDVAERLVNEKNWESRYRNIMLLGKQLAVMPVELKTNDALVQGCESHVWFHHSFHNNRLQLAVSSDAKIVKGLISIVLAIFNNKTQSEIASINIEHLLDKLNLLEHLSPSRTNGIFAIIEKIKSL